MSSSAESAVVKCPWAHSRNRCGTSSIVSTHPAAVEAMISSITTPVATPAV